MDASSEPDVLRVGEKKSGRGRKSGYKRKSGREKKRKLSEVESDEDNNNDNNNEDVDDTTKEKNILCRA